MDVTYWSNAEDVAYTRELPQTLKGNESSSWSETADFDEPTGIRRKFYFTPKCDVYLLREAAAIKPFAAAYGTVKFRYDKKWKKRYYVLTKRSPINDYLSLSIYRDQSERRTKLLRQEEVTVDFFVSLTTTELYCEQFASVLTTSTDNATLQFDAGTPELSVFCKTGSESNKHLNGLEHGIPSAARNIQDSVHTIKGEQHVLALISTKRTLSLLAFSNSDELANWTERVRSSLPSCAVSCFNVERTEIETTSDGSFDNNSTVHVDGSVSIPSSIKLRTSVSHRGVYCITTSRAFFVRTGSVRNDREVPAIERFWEVVEIRAYGVINTDLFAVEGGSRSETSPGCHVFRASHQIVHQIERQMKDACSGRFLLARMNSSASNVHTASNSCAGVSSAVHATSTSGRSLAQNQNHSSHSARHQTLPDNRRRASAESSSFFRSPMTLMPIEIDSLRSDSPRSTKRILNSTLLPGAEDSLTELDQSALINSTLSSSTQGALSSITNNSAGASHFTLNTNTERTNRRNNYAGWSNAAAAPRANVEMPDHVDVRAYGPLLERMTSENGRHSYENLPTQMQTPTGAQTAKLSRPLLDANANASVTNVSEQSRRRYTLAVKKDDYAALWLSKDTECSPAALGSRSELSRSQTFPTTFLLTDSAEAASSRMPTPAYVEMQPPVRTQIPQGAPFASASVTRATSKTHSKAPQQTTGAQPDTPADSKSHTLLGTKREKVAYSKSAKFSGSAANGFPPKLTRRKQSKSSEDVNIGTTLCVSKNISPPLEPQQEALSDAYSLKTQLNALSIASANTSHATGFADDEDEVFETTADAERQQTLPLSPIREDCAPSSVKRDIQSHSHSESRTRSDSSQTGVLAVNVAPHLALSNASPVKRRVKPDQRQPEQASAKATGKRDSGSLSGVPSVPEPSPDTLWVRRSRSAERVSRRSHHDYQNLPPHTGNETTDGADHYENVNALGVAIKGGDALSQLSSTNCEQHASASNVCKADPKLNTNTNTNTMVIKKRDLSGTTQESRTDADRQSSLPRSRSHGHSHSQPQQQVSVMSTATMRPRFGSEYRVPPLNMALTRNDQLQRFDEPDPAERTAKASKPIPIASNGLYDSHSYVNVQSVSRTPPDGLAGPGPSGQLVCAENLPSESTLSRSAGSSAGYMNISPSSVTPHSHARSPQPTAEALHGYGEIMSPSVSPPTGVLHGLSKLSQPPAEVINPLLNYADMRSNADGTLAMSPSLAHARTTYSNSLPSPSTTAVLTSNKRSPENGKLNTSVKVKNSASAQRAPSSASAPLNVSPKRASPSNVALSRSPSRGTLPSNTQRELNYADLDFSNHAGAAPTEQTQPSGIPSVNANASTSGLRVASHGDHTEYAQIDELRTEALSRYTKEQLAQRESRFREQQAAASTNSDTAQPTSANRRSLLAEFTSAFRPRAPESTA